MVPPATLVQTDDITVNVMRDKRIVEIVLPSYYPTVAEGHSVTVRPTARCRPGKPRPRLTVTNPWCSRQLNKLLSDLASDIDDFVEAYGVPGKVMLMLGRNAEAKDTFLCQIMAKSAFRR